MIHQLIWPVHWDNCNNVEHAVSLQTLSNTILHAQWWEMMKTRKMLDEEIVSSLFLVSRKV